MSVIDLSNGTMKDAMKHMLSHSHIHIIRTYNEVERIFNKILTTWNISQPVLPPLPQQQSDEGEWINSSPYVVGLDMEWKPLRYSKGQQSISDSDDVDDHRVAVLQICLQSSEEEMTASYVTYVIYMHQLFPIDCPLTRTQCSLFTFLTSSEVLKCGVGIAGDRRKLENDYGIRMKGLIELGMLYRRVESLPCQYESNHKAINSLRGKPPSSLEGIVNNVCNVSLEKNKIVQCSDWSVRALTMEQLLYAAADAYYSLRAYQGLVKQTHGKLKISNETVLNGIIDTISKRNTCKIQCKTSLYPANKKATRNGLTTAKSPIYDSCALLTKNGLFLSYCNLKRLNWYLSKGLADELPADEVLRCIEQGIISSTSGSCRVIRLNFEAKGEGNLNDPYKRQLLLNKCVVCGIEEISTDSTKENPDSYSTSETANQSPLILLHHHVVPKVFRQIFPTQMVTKNNHDILPVCKECKAQVAIIYSTKMQELESLYLDESDKVALKKLQHSAKNAMVRLSKVRGYCKTILTGEFHKKVTTFSDDGTKRTESIRVSDSDANIIKEKILKTLKNYYQQIEFSVTGEKRYYFKREVDNLEINKIEKIKLFQDEFEQCVMNDIKGESSRGDGDVFIRNKETLIIQKVISPYSLDDEEELCTPLLQSFEKMWRSFFLESVQPKHMPLHWQVDYVHIVQEDNVSTAV